jgi:hypothetical protein
MNDQLLWNSTREAWSALAPHYEPVIHKLNEETGLQSQAWGLLLAALTFEPEQTTPAHLMIRVPYTSAEKYLDRLRAIARQELMEEVEAGKFILTANGRSETIRFIEEVRAAMSAADPLSYADSMRLAILLDHLVSACRDTPPPPDTGLAATTLEALTLLWRGEADSLSALIEKLEPRGHESVIYESALEELRQRNYVTGDNSSLQVSLTGIQFREAIEDQTNRFFFRPWNQLEEAEKQELEGLLTNLRNGLRAGSAA